MSVERLQNSLLPGVEKISNHCRGTNAAQPPSMSAISEVGGSYECEPNDAVSDSHPGLLALARILGRSAARADLRRTRRGAVPIMAVAEALLVVAAMIAGALVWSVIRRLR